MTDFKKLSNVNQKIKKTQSQENSLLNKIEHNKEILNTKMLNLLNKYFLKKSNSFNSRFINGIYFLDYKDYNLFYIKVILSSNKKIENLNLNINYSNFQSLSLSYSLLKEMSIILSIFETKKDIILTSLFKLSILSKKNFDSIRKKQYLLSNKLIELRKKKEIIYKNTLEEYITQTRFKLKPHPKTKKYLNHTIPSSNIELRSITHIQYNKKEKLFEFTSSEKNLDNNFIIYKLKTTDPSTTFLSILDIIFFVDWPNIFLKRY